MTFFDRKEAPRPSRLPEDGATLRLWLAAFLAGLFAAAATIAFRVLIDLTEWLFTQRTGSLVSAVHALPAWQRILVPTVGGLVAGLVLDIGGRWSAGATHIDYIDAARAGGVALNDRTNTVRTLSSLLSVGSGAAIGREGPMVQLSAWLSSWLARLFPLNDKQRNAILVCGIAAGIGSAYHAPLAGVVFVLELALGFFARHTVAPILISAVTSSALIYWLVEPRPLYVMPSVPIAPTGLIVAVAVGTASGLLGLALLKLIERARRGFAAIGPAWLRLGAGGAVVGLLSVPVPEVWGNGYSVVSRVLDGGLTANWAAMVLVAKLIATIAATGSGAIGGIFTPTLFVGATSGYLLGSGLEHWGRVAAGADPVAVAVLGMAAVLAAVTHAPLMAIVIVLEMTNQFQLVLPVMLACGVAHAISSRFGVKPLYGNPIEHHT